MLGQLGLILPLRWPLWVQLLVALRSTAPSTLGLRWSWVKPCTATTISERCSSSPPGPSPSPVPWWPSAAGSTSQRRRSTRKRGLVGVELLGGKMRDRRIDGGSFELAQGCDQCPIAIVAGSQTLPPHIKLIMGFWG